MSIPQASAVGIMAHSLVALLSRLNQDVLSPTRTMEGGMGIACLALPVRSAQMDTEYTI